MNIISIEGPDRLGKTTISKLLAERLGYTYIKFPNEDYYSGKIIRQILKRELPFEPASFQALQILNRFETFEHLDPDGDYIFDRYKLSGIVYALADGLPDEWIRETCNYLPDADYTIVLYGIPYGEDDDIYSAKQNEIARLYCEEIITWQYPSVYVNGQTVEELYAEIVAKLPEELL